ncbi:MAG: choice-of-anchor tandem repeat GloVer-containing protein [Verrucomicrobiota bacterium]|jgi:uncharacterized repeat protein (TIGR03803 family)
MAKAFALITGIGLIMPGWAPGQTFATLHTFSGGSDGGQPLGGLILSSNTLYGTASGGGTAERGTVFKVSTDGTGFATLHIFTGASDGSAPFAGLILLGNTLYGTANSGGGSTNGTVFAVNTNGTGFRTLHSFASPAGGANPQAGLVLSGKTLYGTTYRGGISTNGTVFKVNTNGTGFTRLYSFILSDAYFPVAALVLSSNTLYGTTYDGGGQEGGTVFKVSTGGTGFAYLHTFTGGSDEAGPAAGLILTGNTLYGTVDGGRGSRVGRFGTVFKVNTDGTGFATLHSFTGGAGGAWPEAGLVLSGSTMYGTTSGGGNSGNGTMFKVNTDGAGFANLYSFNGGNDGANPQAGLILSGNTLYGTTQRGGSAGEGTVFSLTLAPVSAPELTIIRSEANVSLTWPANATGFTLQSTTNLVSPALWTNFSSVPVVVNGQNAVTNPISGTQRFYRLSQ